RIQNKIIVPIAKLIQKSKHIRRQQGKRMAPLNDTAVTRQPAAAVQILEGWQRLIKRVGGMEVLFLKELIVEPDFGVGISQNIIHTGIQIGLIVDKITG